jgi:competence protein ComEC
VSIKEYFESYAREHRALSVVICIGTIVFASHYAFIIWHSHEKGALEYEVGKKVSLKGIIIDEPDRRENSTRLIVGLKDLEKAGRARLLITAERYSNWQYGDEISFTGKLQKPENFATDSGREFDYVSYLAKDDIRYEMIYPKITLIAHGKAGFVRDKLLKIKNAFTKSIESSIPEPESSLLGGLLLGSKHSLGKKLLEDFQKAGLIHIVVLSGYNIAIIAEFIMWFLGFLPKRIGLLFGAIGMLLFVGMTGAGASTIRATIMALLVVLSKALGRTYTASRALFIAAFGMLIFNPRILLSDPSFQLSFLATFGLIYVSPIVQEKLPFGRFLPEKFKIRELVISTLTTQIFLLPFLLYQTGMLSLVALPVNLLVLAFIPFTMLMGFITGLVGFISPIFALPFAFLSHLLLGYIIYMAEFFASLRFSVFTLNAFPFWVVTVTYVFYFYYLWRFHGKISKKPQV